MPAGFAAVEVRLRAAVVRQPRVQSAADLLSEAAASLVEGHDRRREGVGRDVFQRRHEVALHLPLVLLVDRLQVWRRRLLPRLKRDAGEIGSGLLTIV
jgi:hypothetical protein